MAINNQYEGKSAEEVWNDLSTKQRTHFLLDHHDKILQQNKSQRIQRDDLESVDILHFAHENFHTLPEAIVRVFSAHRAEGQYAKGGGISSFFNKAKKIGSKGYDFTKKHASAGYEKTKQFAKDKIHNERKKIALRVLDETEGKVSGKYKKVLSNAGDIVVEEYAKGGKIPESILRQKRAIEEILKRKGVRLSKPDATGFGMEASYNGHHIEGENYYVGEETKKLPADVIKLIDRHLELYGKALNAYEGHNKYAQGGNVREYDYFVYEHDEMRKASKADFKYWYKNFGAEVMDRFGKTHKKGEIPFEQVENVYNPQGIMIAEKISKLEKGGIIKSVENFFTEKTSLKDIFG